MKNIYYVQVTDKYSYGGAIELSENMSVETATRMFESCVRNYPSDKYNVQTNLPK